VERVRTQGDIFFELMAELDLTKHSGGLSATQDLIDARVYSSQVPASFRAPAHLNVCLYGEKVGTTPEDYVYEFDV
jgi:hypothetical protein